MKEPNIEMVAVCAGELDTGTWNNGVLGRGDKTDSLADVIAHLTRILHSIPPEFRAGAWVSKEINGGYEGESERCDALKCCYSRPKSAEEFAAERARSEQYEAEWAARERAEYERLRRKFA